MPQLMLGSHGGVRAALQRAHRWGLQGEPFQNNLEKTHSSEPTSYDLQTPSTSSLSQSWRKRRGKLVTLFTICSIFLLVAALSSIYLEEVSWAGVVTCLTLGVFGYILLSYLRSPSEREPTPVMQEGVVTQSKIIVDERSPSPDVKSLGVSIPLALTLADSLLLSVLQEPLADPSGPHVQDLLSRLESMFHILESVHSPSESREEDHILIEKVTLIQSYLHKRSSSLRRLLQVQAEYESSVKELREGVEDRWGRLEELHTGVTLTKEGGEDQVDLASAHQDAESFFAVLSHHREQLEGCQDLLKDSTQLLQELIWSHSHAGNTLKNCSSESIWPEMLLQSNMEQFDKVQESFLSLEQQTATFQAHLKGLATGKETRGASSPDFNGKVATEISAEHPDSDDDSDARKSLCERSAQHLSSTIGRLRKSGKKKKKLIGH
ncbi:uncharacterized protein LOC130911086 isoform X1 [Corythoichthys intestinalis]|uniref:uncharacterized protein LOC130911086 isoform X1 n=2 Tax=Corythoichthys intestinalis TaxID=161448 RepID=UPI0025A51975|nr:uncharacterized protein LOC130911086 isoform X1 [Corythoichthys intestinalis]